MKYLIVALMQMWTMSLFAQTFNSVIKARTFNLVSVQVDHSDNRLQPIEDMVRIYVRDSTTQSNAYHKEEYTPPVIQFAKPLDKLNKTSSYGNRFHPLLKKWRFHSGVDLASRSDTVFSMLSGKIKDSGYSSTLGYYVRTKHSNGKLEVLYAHLSEYYFSRGDSILAGQPLGITGSTGLSTGDHLHLAVYKEGSHIDPIQFMAQILNFNNYQIKSSNERSKRKSNFGIDSDIRAGFASYSID